LLLGKEGITNKNFLIKPGASGFMPVILATWEAEIRRIEV
jgi:hypothetical protein